MKKHDQKSRASRFSLALVLISLATLALSGCTVLSRAVCAPNCRAETHSASGLVEFLYPGGRMPPPQNAMPELRVPLRVGLAFLPPQNTYVAAGPSATQRDELLGRIRERFADRKFVSEIVTIPDYYLRTSRGFEGLRGVQRLYSVDVMALVSYDQVSHLDDNKWSLGYLTIVGAYVLKGSHHDVATLVDLAVVDPVTRSLLLRAGGTDTRTGNTTLVDQHREVRESSEAGFANATAQMIENFDGALTKFEADVRAGKANVRVANRNSPGPGRGGGGSFGLGFLLALLLLSCVGRNSFRRQQSG
jgi:rhombotail lipoprotein